MSTLLIMAGGTGGHVYPALSVAEEMQRRGVEVVWLGTRQGLEARAVPAAGFDIEWITIRCLRRAGFPGGSPRCWGSGARDCWCAAR